MAGHAATSPAGIRRLLTPARKAALMALELAGERGMVSSQQHFLAGLATLGWATRRDDADARLGDRAFVLTPAGRAALAVMRGSAGA